MTGVLICDYILSQKKQAGTLPKDGAIISTIVSTNMTKAIAKYYDVDMYEVLTGFKYIGEKIKEFEMTNSNHFIFGFEESYGCLAGTYARDKDAVVATMLICEMAAFYKTKGMSLYEGLQEVYKKYGFYKETIKSITLKGIEGVEKIKYIMNTLRTSSPTAVNGVKVAELRDYKAQVSKNFITGVDEKINLPVSDVLYYVLEDGAWFCIRPSGTEPKIKVYFGVKGNTAKEADVALAKVCDGAMTIIDELAK
jgi:phosphoglucomutase